MRNFSQLAQFTPDALKGPARAYFLKLFVYVNVT
jgi:hypothetical protein